MNIIQKIGKSHPFIWAIIVFIPFLIETIILPFVILFYFVCEIPRILKNLFNDVKFSIIESVEPVKDLIFEIWIEWFKGLIGKN